MKRILITGATGNIGRSLIKHLFTSKGNSEIIAGVRDVQKSQCDLKCFPLLQFIVFDFENTETFGKALESITTLFLLRPPHITDIKGVFEPLIKIAREKNVKEILFLSVQGAEKSKAIPHNKIEQVILRHRINYVFLRPSYFMQNLTTTLHKDIIKKRKIILPAGNAKFNWIDIENIGEVTATILKNFEVYQNKIIEITGSENLTFYNSADLINEITSNKIEYAAVNPIRFYRIKSKEKIPTGLIIVMILLHFLPRFQAEPKITESYNEICGKSPTTLKEFIFREQDKFTYYYLRDQYL